MVQQDYIRRSQPAFSKRQKSKLRKQSTILSVSTTVVMTIIVTLLAFTIVLFMNNQQYHKEKHKGKKEESETFQRSKVNGNSLPPKPEERWHYIKELESHQLSMPPLTKSSTGNQVEKPSLLTNEQRQLLAQIQADMRQQQPTQLNEVPWNNKQISAQHHNQEQIQQRQEWIQTQPVHQPKFQPYHQLQQQLKAPQSQQKQTTQSPYQDLVQIPIHAAEIQQLKTHQDIPIIKEKDVSKMTKKKDECCWWMVQCGSFKGVEQAENVHIQLVFEGFNSHIITNNGWNRVIIGPVKGKDNAEGILTRLKITGHTNCIRFISKS